MTQCRIEGEALSHDQQGIRPVAQDTDVVGLGVEDAVDTSLAVETPQAHLLSSGIGRVDPGDSQAVGSQSQSIFVYRAQVEHELEAGILRGNES